VFKKKSIPLINNNFVKMIVPLTILFFMVFILRFTSLNSGWSYDESFWILSSSRFISAIKQLDLVGTNIAYHPGVTTMWVGGFSLWIGGQLPLNSKSLSVENLATARMGVAGVTSITIIAIYLFLLQLFNREIALLCTLLITLDPFYLAYSRIIHTDALLASFTTLSVLSLLVYLEKRKCYALILSGIFCGFSLLTKTSGVVLLPYTFIFLVVYYYFNIIENHDGKLDIAASILKTFSAWSSATLITFLVLWPAMWVISLKAGKITIFMLPVLLFICYITTREHSLKSYKLDKCLIIYSVIVIFCFAFLSVGLYKNAPSLILSMKWAFTTPHENPGLFMGKVVRDPGILFYPVIMIMRTTPLSFIFSILSLILMYYNLNLTFTAKGQDHFAKSKRRDRVILMLFLFVGIFTMTMTLAAKKLDRYLLPIFPSIDILAGVTLFYVVRSSYKVIARKRKKHSMKLRFYKISNVIFLLGCIIAFSFHSYKLFLLHPYYLAYYNPLFGGASVAVKTLPVGRGEGIDKAAEYLNGKDNAKKLIVAGDPTSFLRSSDTLELAPYFKGKVVSDPRTADYVILYISDIQIKTPLANKYYLHQTPEYVVEISGIDYVWIYKNLKNQ